MGRRYAVTLQQLLLRLLSLLPPLPVRLLPMLCSHTDSCGASRFAGICFRRSCRADPDIQIGVTHWLSDTRGQPHLSDR